MKQSVLAFVLVIGALGGCSSQPQPAPSPGAKMTAQQNIDQIKSDSKIPDGLKKIQTETLQHQPGVKR